MFNEILSFNLNNNIKAYKMYYKVLDSCSYSDLKISRIHQHVFLYERLKFKV